MIEDQKIEASGIPESGVSRWRKSDAINAGLAALVLAGGAALWSQLNIEKEDPTKAVTPEEPKDPQRRPAPFVVPQKTDVPVLQRMPDTNRTAPSQIKNEYLTPAQLDLQRLLKAGASDRKLLDALVVLDKEISLIAVASAEREEPLKAIPYYRSAMMVIADTVAALREESAKSNARLYSDRLESRSLVAYAAHCMMHDSTLTIQFSPDGLHAEIGELVDGFDGKDVYRFRPIRQWYLEKMAAKQAKKESGSEEK